MEHATDEQFAEGYDRFLSLCKEAKASYGVPLRWIVSGGLMKEAIVESARMDILRVMDLEYDFSNPILATYFHFRCHQTVIHMRRRMHKQARIWRLIPKKDFTDLEKVPFVAS